MINNNITFRTPLVKIHSTTVCDKHYKTLTVRVSCLLVGGLQELKCFAHCGPGAIYNVLYYKITEHWMKLFSKV